MKDIQSFLEQTNLKPTVAPEDIDDLVEQAVEHRFLGICVPPFWVKRASREIGSREVTLVTVVGFPLGYQMTGTKMTTISKAIDDGVDELDVVMNISAFKSGMPWAKIELAKCSTLIHENGKVMKVIVETAFLDQDELARVCKMCADVGADFVKTSTGFADGAKVEDIALMRKLLPQEVGIKASGGIKTYGKAFAMINAGADRIGTSSAVDIVRGAP